MLNLVRGRSARPSIGSAKMIGATAWELVLRRVGEKRAATMLKEGKSHAGLARKGSGYSSAMFELVSVVIHPARAAVRGRNELILENLLLRHQLQVALRPKRRLSLRRRDRFLWVLVRQLRPDWRRYLLYVRPETVIRWHRHGWRLYWRWRSRTRLGRPRLPAEVRALIARMASDNPLWGTERIRGELLKLGLGCLS